MSDFFSGEESKIVKIIQKDNRKTAIQWFFKHYISLFSIFLLLVAGFAFFITSFDFPSKIDIREITINFIIVLACSYVLFINGSIIGGNGQKKTNDYLNAIDNYKKYYLKINEKQISYLITEFCEYYVQEELKSARQSILLPNNVTLQQYYDYLDNKELNLNIDQKQAIQEAKAIKPIKLTKTMLIDRHGGGNGRNPIITKKEIKSKKVWGYMMKGISLTIFSLAVVDFVPEVFLDFSLQTIITALIKITSMIFGFAMGIKFGFNIECLENQRLDETNSMLEQFLEWENKRNI